MASFVIKYCCLLVLLTSYTQAQLALLPDGNNVCNRTVTSARGEPREFYQSVTQSYQGCCADFLICWNHCTKYRMVAERFVQTVYITEQRTEHFCCPGYKQVGRECTEPICEEGCGTGLCVQPNVCDCAGTGYGGDNCTRDVDECEVENGGCAQTCSNTDGSYHCSCQNGFVLDTNQRTCSDVDECVGNHQCQQNCNNFHGNFFCSCNSGYAIQSNNKTCSLKDICKAQNPCQQNCTLTEGTVDQYSCSCFPGFQMVDGSCVVIKTTSPPLTTTPNATTETFITFPNSLAVKSNDDDEIYYIGIPIIVLGSILIFSLCCLFFVAIRRRRRRKYDNERVVEGVANPVYLTEDGLPLPQKLHAYEAVDEKMGAVGIGKEEPSPELKPASGAMGSKLNLVDGKQENIYVRHPESSPVMRKPSWVPDNSISQPRTDIKPRPKDGPLPLPKPRPNPYETIDAFQKKDIEDYDKLWNKKPEE